MEFSASFFFLLLCSLQLLFFFLLRIFLRINSNKTSITLPFPPSASPLPVLIHTFLHRRSIFEIAPILRHLHILHGPIFSLRIPPFSNLSVFISDPQIAHSALILHGAAFAGRPAAASHLSRLFNSHDISSSTYGPFWRALRRNLSAEILNPSRIRLFAPARIWALQRLFESLRSRSGRGDVPVKESFNSSIFSLIALLCLGFKLTEREIGEIEYPMRFLMRIYASFNVFAFAPTVTKFLFRKRWEKIVSCKRREAEILISMIRARRDRNRRIGIDQYCYVDSLLDLRISEEGGRGLSDEEMAVLCHEFLVGGIDTTVTALEWTMAELARNQAVQSRLWAEIESSSDGGEFIKDEDLQTMPYLKAVVMESLRRHPPGHFLLPHSVAEDVTVSGFVIPKGTTVSFSVADVNWDGRIWEEPFEFRPERFMADGEGEGMDMSGSREIRVMTFGAGRRMCPGYGLAMLHLEFFVANLVKEFEWKVEEGEEMDLSEKLEFTTVMKKPLRAKLVPRCKK